MEDLVHPGSAFVRVFHPSEGLAPDDIKMADGQKLKTRKAYLNSVCKMRPRNEYYQTHHWHAGWKNPGLDCGTNKYMHVYWFPHWSGELFLNLWHYYMRQRYLLKCNHPLAFVTKSGSPYTIREFKRAHARAVKQIGLVPAKMNGTTPHGHRHEYAQRVTRGISQLPGLKNNFLSRKILMKVLHQNSEKSSEAYTEIRSIDETCRLLNRASDCMKEHSEISREMFRLLNNDGFDFVYDNKAKRKYPI
jgi:hypothetical protein